MRTIIVSLISWSFSLVGLVACGGGHGNGNDGGDGNALCGGIAAKQCSATEYCDYGNNSCGMGDQSGTCKPRPEACPLIIGLPACGCNNTVYTSKCVAYMHGADLNPRGTCAAPSGWFTCGYTQCQLSTSYCVHERHPPAADTYRCAELPACASQPPTCACLAGEPCGTACTGDAAVGLTLTCS